MSDKVKEIVEWLRETASHTDPTIGPATFRKNAVLVDFAWDLIKVIERRWGSPQPCTEGEYKAAFDALKADHDRLKEHFERAKSAALEGALAAEENERAARCIKNLEEDIVSLRKAMTILSSIKGIEVLTNLQGADQVSLQLNLPTPFPKTGDGAYAAIHCQKGYGAEWAKANFPGIPIVVLDCKTGSRTSIT